MSIIVTKTISWIFATFSICGHANNGNAEKMVVTNIQMMKIRRTILSRVQGIFFGSREINMEISVTMATMYANGIS